MLNRDDPSASLLLRCEADGYTTDYETSVRNVSIAHSEGDIFIVSDFHMASGKRTDGNYGGTENFFADSSFRRFLGSALKSAPKNRNLLILNGDFVDFFRIQSAPKTDDEFRGWQKMLAEIGLNRSVEELRESVSGYEHEYGLKTHDFKSVWKMDAAINGHPEVFDTLANWLLLGNRIFIVKGNHDLEWYWKAVRDHLRLALAKQVASRKGIAVEAALTDVVFPDTVFIDHSVTINDELYVEHGQQYERLTSVRGGPVLEQSPDQLNVSFGSFFNRYLLNRIELIYPYLDNVRPSENLLPVLIREHFTEALKLLSRVRLTLKLIPKGYWRYVLGRPLVYGLIILVPVVMAISLLLVTGVWRPLLSTIEDFVQEPSLQALGSIADLVWQQVSKLGLLLVSYFLSRGLAHFQIGGAHSFEQFLEVPLKNAEEAGFRRLNAFGHTHNPAQFVREGRHYYNTGTWIPVFETSSREVREDMTYTFLRLRLNSSDKLEPAALMRWDDQAGRVEPALLIGRKTP